ncbi:glycoside hydrolase family 15 protein [Candidatus Kaiserbacteria bacterium]|nr:glycoside hydrolase family 15 protein [Candidatus Kaiserbacteria bacterium]
MSRSIVLSNGELCVAIDHHGFVRDLYYPHVGLEDHVRGHYIHRIGVWVDGEISWLSDDASWEITVGCEERALTSAITARNSRIGVELAFKDVVYNERPIFLRNVAVTNTTDRSREIKLYFHQQFEIYKSHGGDTAYFDPTSHAIIHYKGRRVFLVGASMSGEPFSDYATGITGFLGKEGSYRDADDGMLSRNPIEHGQVDSTIGLYSTYAPGETHTVYYWLAAAQSINEVLEHHQYVQKKGPEHLVQTVSNFWNAWLGAYEWNFYGLTAEQITLFYRSLMYVRAHVDVGGGIIAAVDSDMLQYGLDTYAYVWPRDAAYAALALDRAGDTNVAKRFFEFCQSVISHNGYFMHKYLPDGSLGSSWHPWIKDGRLQIPIQEDETALVIFALREHYRHSRDLEFLELIFNPLVEKAADFMVHYRDRETKLPDASYDLWEEKRGTSTFTASSVYGALVAAADLSKVLGKQNHEARYRTAAAEVREAILKHLYDERTGMFVKLVTREGGNLVHDKTIDISSVYGVFSFGVLPPDDPRLSRAFEGSVRTLSRGITIGGIARYEGDNYFRVDAEAVGCPWITTTLWYAEYLIANAHTDADFDRVREIFHWVVRYAQPSGILAEQLNPKTGAQASASPLVWSHASYVSAILKYLDRIEELGICFHKVCNPVP